MLNIRMSRTPIEGHSRFPGTRRRVFDAHWQASPHLDVVITQNPLGTGI